MPDNIPQSAEGEVVIFATIIGLIRIDSGVVFARDAGLKTSQFGVAKVSKVINGNVEVDEIIVDSLSRPCIKPLEIGQTGYAAGLIVPTDHFTRFIQPLK